MNDPDTAAQDPIFWLHHSNIDRLWAVWGGKGHRNPTDPSWLNQQFSFFDEHGQPVSMTATQVLDTVTDLGYTYDQLVAPGPPPPPTKPSPAPTPPPAHPAPSPAAARMSESISNNPELIGAMSTPLTLTGDTAQVAVEIDARAAASALASLATTTPRILLEVHEVQAERHPGTVYGVYVNLPAGASASEEAAAQVGNLSFFGVERARDPSRDEPAHGLSLTFDITALAEAQRASGVWNDQAVSVTFEPLRLVPPEGEETAGPGDGPEPPATVGSISLFYA
jgi:tyrosinase